MKHTLQLTTVIPLLCNKIRRQPHSSNCRNTQLFCVKPWFYV